MNPQHHPRNTKLRYISIFSGIEAASVAWEPLGFRPLAFAEVDPFPSAVLKARYPHVPNLGDVTKIDWSEFIAKHGKPDLLVGGSPCQSFSIAGGRESLNGESRLMFEYIRAIDEVRPKWLLWENVPGALSAKGLEGEKGGAFQCLLRELAELGYGLCWKQLDACHFGVPQRRRRIFLVGCLGDPERAAKVLFEPDCLRGDHPSSKQKREELARAARIGAATAGAAAATGPLTSADKADKAYTMVVRCGCEGGGKGALVAEDISMTLSTHNTQTLFQPAEQVVCLADDNAKAACDVNLAGALKVGGSAPIVSKREPVYCRASGMANAEQMEECCPTMTARQHKDPPILFPSGDAAGSHMVVRRLTPVECERLQGFPDNWTRIPWRGKAEEDCPDSPRYKAIGNSMAVPVMRWIGERIAQVEQGHGELGK